MTSWIYDFFIRNLKINFLCTFLLKRITSIANPRSDHATRWNFCWDSTGLSTKLCTFCSHRCWCWHSAVWRNGKKSQKLTTRCLSCALLILQRRFETSKWVWQFKALVFKHLLHGILSNGFDGIDKKSTLVVMFPRVQCVDKCRFPQH